MNFRLVAALLKREWAHHPWRHGVALLAVALGVALAYSVHLINTSALSEFSAAVRAANGEPDLTIRGQREGFDDALFDRVATDAAVEAASPIVEFETYATAGAGAAGEASSPRALARAAGEAAEADPAPAASSAAGDGAEAPVRSRGAEEKAPTRVPMRVVGVDGLRVAPLAATLLPRPADEERPLAGLDPGLVFLNAAARERTGAAVGGALALQSGPGWQRFEVGGDIAAGGSAMAVVDIAAAQARFGFEGRLTRIDLRLAPGADRAALVARLALPAGVEAVAPGEAEQRVSNLSRAYRVNLTVLALVALFVGAFLVFSVVALSVAQRTPTFALLGVLGLTAGERRGLVLAECAALGLAGSLIGLAGGAAMAAAALRWMAGDLGGGYFPGIAPTVSFGVGGAVGFALLGTASALVGGWWPAKQAEALAPAQALKGLGAPQQPAPPAWPGLALLAAGAALAFAPPLGGLPVAAYLSVAALLFGGVALIPAVVHALLAGVAAPRSALALLALQRAKFQRATATAAVSGVVASLALSVALTVMVASFRDGVANWLDSMLPAELYARSAATSGTTEQAWLPPDFVAAAAAVPGVARVQATRHRSLQLAPGRPAVALLARPVADAATALPLVGDALPRRAGEVGVWVSEAMVDLYGAAVGGTLALPLAGGVPTEVRVLGVWRDYARQFGSIVVDEADYRRLTGDTRVNDLALWLAPGARLADVQTGLRALLADPSMLEFAATGELRVMSMRIFDRSFAVTYYLQAVAIAIGLVGIAASLSAQVLARRKEFGLLAHLGLTRGQVVAVVAGEGAAWLAAGVLVGLALGMAVAAVLVHVVNPQSFHWTMDLVVPAGRLAALAAAVLAAGIATAAFAARSAAGRNAVLSVKEDW